MSLSKEAQFGLWASIIFGGLFVLLDPKQPLVRGGMWFAIALSVVAIATDLDWVKQRAWNMDIFSDAGMSEQLSYPRLFLATLAVATSVVGLAMITWPAKDVPLQPISVVAGVRPETPTDSSSTAVGIPDPPKKTTPPTDVPKGSPPSTPPKPRPKPVPETTPHPIIVAGNSEISINSETHKIDGTLQLLNTSSVGANVHITTDITLDGQPISAVDSRDVAIAPQPFVYTLSFTSTLSSLDAIGFDNRTRKLAIVLNASYPDEGNIITYRYEGVIAPGATKLDSSSSGWDTAPAKP